MQNRRSDEDETEAGISLNRVDQRKLIDFLNRGKTVKGISEGELDAYRRGERKFIPYQDFKAFIYEFGVEFLDIFLES